MANVLVIHDQIPLRKSLLDYVRRSGHAGFEAANLRHACARVGPAGYALVIVGMSDAERSETKVKEIKHKWPMAEIAVIRNSTDLGDVIDAISHCGYGSPMDPARETQTTASLCRGWNTPPDHSETRSRQNSPWEEVVIVDPLTCAVYAKADRAAAVNSTVLISGETGTGKEVLARRIHRHSRRHGFKFVPVNCGSLPETLIETELFGHKKGAFTGAVSDNRGLIEEAERGVLFLDEIGDMPVSMQVRLLRFLDSGEIRAVGDTCVKHVDVRVVAATNQNLQSAIREKRFREDLFFRLSVVSLELPPLRERRRDIPGLVNHHTRRAALKLGIPVPTLSEEALSLLVHYCWPGNIRELQNAIEQALVQKSGQVITPDDLPPAIQKTHAAAVTVRALDNGATQDTLMMALRRNNGNQTETAAELGISRTTLWRRLRQLRGTLIAETIDTRARSSRP